MTDTKMEDGTFSCNVCDLTVPSQQLYEAHMQGTNHEKNVKLAELGVPVVTETNNGTGNETTPKSAKKKKAEPSFCDLCQVVLTSPVMATSHYAGAKHTKKAKALEAGTDNGTSTETTPKAGKKRKAEMSTCDICQVELTSPVMASSHYAGSKHAKKLKALETVDEVTAPINPLNPDGTPKEAIVNKGTGFYCSFCNITLNSPQQLEQHRTGAKHKKLVQKSHEASGAFGSANKSNMAASTPTAMQTATPTSTDQYEFMCSICCLTMTTEPQYFTHMKSLEHKRRLAEVGGLAMPAQEMGDMGDFPTQL